MRIVYVAHPLGAGPDRARDITTATKWVAWLRASRSAGVPQRWLRILIRKEPL